MPIRRMSLIVVAAAILAATPGPTAAAPLTPLKPWVLDYAENQCNASRQYGSAKDPIVLVIRPAPNGQFYELLVGSSEVGPRYAEELKGSVDFGQGPIKAWLLHFGAKGKKLDVYAYRISASEMAHAGRAGGVNFVAKDTIARSFTLDQMAELLSGLEKCTEDLKRYWNMDAAQSNAIATPAKGDMRVLFTSEDYPAEALRGNKEGTVQFLLLIDERGSVAGCHVERPSGIPILDAMGCQVMRERAKFTPARDAQGHPVRSAVTTPSVSWRLGV